jgi:hypothetical protein
MVKKLKPIFFEKVQFEKTCNYRLPIILKTKVGTQVVFILSMIQKGCNLHCIGRKSIHLIPINNLACQYPAQKMDRKTHRASITI